ncbi:50S ribosomal protein L10 [Buchnera aphidicola]|uniref:Large ribosomal subunit protein uL10 n=1 Tax=Buchnera aphidicola (Cinara strobi) TaxID=1921549 RepID=A0A3B1DVD9_9GAMM|nr:50S ribosomal protein L10 [Buchnera aphidicola]VAX76223.1 50S ribosomal protein L10 [Buchnera aphidicola (Cinara strobi)]
MALNHTQKKNIIKKINKIAKKSLSVIMADPSRLTVNTINTLRKKALHSHVKIFVIKNTLLKKSLQKTNFSKLNTTLNGPSLIAFSIKHPGSASRLFIKFQKKNTQFKIKNAVYEKKILDLKSILTLSKLPTYKEAITQLTITLKEISLGKLLRTLHQITKKKQKCIN